MDLSSLNDEQVKYLISELKKFLGNVVIDVPQFGKYKKEFEVAGTESDLDYRLHIYRGNLENKYSLHLRFSETNDHLVRLCINGSNHHNSDGSTVGRNHVHIYKLLEDGDIEGYAYSLDSYPFNQDDNLNESIDKFVNYLNIQEGGA